MAGIVFRAGWSSARMRPVVPAPEANGDPTTSALVSDPARSANRAATFLAR